MTGTGFALSVAIGEPCVLRFLEKCGLLRLELLQRFLVNVVEFRVGLFPLVIDAVLHVFGGDRVLALRGGQAWNEEEKQSRAKYFMNAPQGAANQFAWRVTAIPACPKT